MPASISHSWTYFNAGYYENEYRQEGARIYSPAWKNCFNNAGNEDFKIRFNNIAMAVRSDTYEEDNRTGVNHEGPHANTPVKRLAATSIIGDPVEDHNGQELGKIDNIMINLSNYSIDYVIVEYGGFFGIGGKLFAIPYGELKINPNRRSYVLKRDKEDLLNAPAFNRSRWPDSNDHSYFKNVNKYYKAPDSLLP